MDLQQVLNNIQIYNSNVTLQNLQTCLARFDAQSDSFVQSVINNIQQQGMLPYLQSAQSLANKFAANGDYSGNAMTSPPASTSRRPPVGTDPGDGSGGGGYSCSADNFALTGAGLAFLTIAVMSAGTAPILMGAAWGAIAAWGGGMTTLWGVGHNLRCGF